MNPHAEQAAYRRRIPELGSEALRMMAQALVDAGVRITSFGPAWGNARGHWIYFDTVLDLEALRRQHALPEHLEIHENRDPRSGTERGFFDPKTGEGLMGRLP